jgi:hypothetical protein
VVRLGKYIGKLKVQQPLNTVIDDGCWGNFRIRITNIVRLQKQMEGVRGSCRVRLT